MFVAVVVVIVIAITTIRRVASATENLHELAYKRVDLERACECVLQC